jgi:tetratricopeptide (TPR) repeat protein
MNDSNLTTKKSYDLFGLNSSASIDEIKTTYRQLAKEIHPDLHPNDPNARERFATLNQAYQILLAAVRSTADNHQLDPDRHPDLQSKDTSVRVNYTVEPPLTPEDLQLKQEIFASLEKSIRQGDFKQAVATIDLLVRVIPDRTDILKKQSEIYFQYAQDLVKQRRQLNLARTYLKESLKIDPHDRQRWQAVNREFNRIERLLM